MTGAPVPTGADTVIRVEDTDGHRYWLFREGLYERETARPRWFMHGVFG